MPRPFRIRKLFYCPPVDTFLPSGAEENEFINLTLDEFEAIRLADYLGLNHNEARLMMSISRPTFSRLIEQAHKKIAQALTEGKGIKISGGPVQLPCQDKVPPKRRCCHKKRHCPLKNMQS